MNQYRTTVKRLVSPKTFWDKAVSEEITFTTDEKPRVQWVYGDNYLFSTNDTQRHITNVQSYIIEPLPLFHENAPINQLPRHAVFQIIRDAVRSEMERMAKEEQS